VSPSEEATPSYATQLNSEYGQIDVNVESKSARDVYSEREMSAAVNPANSSRAFASVLVGRALDDAM
jgi:hypothetical protein